MALWGKTDATGSIPVYLSVAETAKAVFVDTTEAALAENKARGINGAGWWLVNTYTDANGNTRHKTEQLVPMKVAQGDAGDTIGDDAIVADVSVLIAISGQPTAQNTSAGAATFAVTAISTPPGDDSLLTFQWQLRVAGAGKWKNVASEVAASIVLAGQIAANDTDEYRVKVSSSNGAPELVSDAAVLTFVS
jgi:hypothetical protein